MTKRGKILRGPRSSPGLLMVEGRQYWFSIEEVWKAQIPPQPGLDVEVKFDRTGRILEITGVCNSQFARKLGQLSTISANMTGSGIFRKIAAKCGMSDFLRR